MNVDVEKYTRDDLMAARVFVLAMKRTARQGGFGQIAGRMIRETLGYKFDTMPIDACLASMECPEFLTAYTAKLEQWYNALNKSATENTLKRNKGLYEAAKPLATDATAWAYLVRALRIICKRNQEWREKGNHLDLTMNGHKALLDLFGVNVTNARRLALTAE